MAFTALRSFKSLAVQPCGEESDMRLVKINWDDAFSLPDEWMDLPLEPLDTRPMVSVGFIVQETDWCYAIAHTYDEHGESCCGVIVIPKGMVTKVTDLA